jgi:hypothetical protein
LVTQQREGIHDKSHGLLWCCCASATPPTINVTATASKSDRFPVQLDANANLVNGCGIVLLPLCEAMTLPSVNALRMPDLFRPPCERAAVTTSPQFLARLHADARDAGCRVHVDRDGGARESL